MATNNDYVFVTHWRVEGTIEEVSEILDDPLSLPRWWPAVYLEVRKLPDGVIDLYTKGWLPYTLRWRFRVTESRKPHGFTIEAFGDGGLNDESDLVVDQLGHRARADFADVGDLVANGEQGWFDLLENVGVRPDHDLQ